MHTGWPCRHIAFKFISSASFLSLGSTHACSLTCHISSLPFHAARSLCLQCVDSAMPSLCFATLHKPAAGLQACIVLQFSTAVQNPSCMCSELQGCALHSKCWALQLA
ncbi:hypothetical protein ABPG75_005395 [Micractinium tetrahymenae]